MKRRMEITIEVEELRFMCHRSSGSYRAWCPHCVRMVTMLMPEQASVLAGASVRTLNRLVESDGVHFQETSDGLLLLCANSLPRIA